MKNIYTFLTTIPVFMISFIISVSDSFIGAYLKNILEHLSAFKFWILYALFMYILFKISKSMIELSSVYFISKEDRFNLKIIKIFKVFLLAYFLGFMINCANQFVIVVFDRFITGGNNFVF